MTLFSLEIRHGRITNLQRLGWCRMAYSAAYSTISTIVLEPNPLQGRPVDFPDLTQYACCQIALATAVARPLDSHPDPDLYCSTPADVNRRQHGSPAWAGLQPLRQRNDFQGEFAGTSTQRPVQWPARSLAALGYRLVHEDRVGRLCGGRWIDHLYAVVPGVNGGSRRAVRRSAGGWTAGQQCHVPGLPDCAIQTGAARNRQQPGCADDLVCADCFPDGVLPDGGLHREHLFVFHGQRAAGKSRSALVAGGAAGRVRYPDALTGLCAVLADWLGRFR